MEEVALITEEVVLITEEVAFITEEEDSEDVEMVSVSLSCCWIR